MDGQTKHSSVILFVRCFYLGEGRGFLILISLGAESTYSQRPRCFLAFFVSLPV